jgi:dihydroorotate dehydrogenase
MYKSIIRPILFKFYAEDVHNFVFGSIKFFSKIPGFPALFRLFFNYEDKSLERTVFGIKFKNPVGLAAGLDKDAELFDELANFGFGFIEIGTVTPKDQPGNPAPRAFRLISDEGLINRMGFNNKGAVNAKQLLKKRKSGIVIGGNIGKNKITPNEDAVNDYVFNFETLFDVVDYFVVNVSSPNTPNLRELQDKEPLTNLLTTLQNLNTKKEIQKPILLKIAPDLTNEQLDDIVDIVNETKIAGLIATNTTISREGLTATEERIKEIGAGGLSGVPVRKRSTEVVRYLAKKSNGNFPIIGVGGIHTAEDAIEKLEAGATLVQVYTGFIYEGPSIVKNICKGLVKAGI